MIKGKFTKNHLILLISSIFLSLILIPAVKAGVPGPGPAFMKLVELIVHVFGFEWLKGMGENATVAFVRFLIFIFIARLLYAAASMTPIDTRTATVSSIVIALLGTIGIPKLILIGIIEMYSVAITIFLLAIPIYGIWWLFSRIPPASLFSIGLRMILLAILIGVTGAVTFLIAYG